MTEAELQAIARAVRREHAAEIIESRVASHWSTLTPSIDDEETVISAALTGYMAPIETGVPRAAFTGHRWNIWQAIEFHYAEAAGFEAPDLHELARYMHESGVRGPVLEELTTLRDSMAFVCHEYVLRSAARIVEVYRARELCGALERIVLRLHAGDPVCQVLEMVRKVANT